MVDYLVLGLLMYRPLTMYDIKKAMEKSTDHFYGSSFGSLHPALKKLTDKEWVTFEQTLERGRGKKTYSITEAGKQEFLVWLQKDIAAEAVREPSLLKVFFLGHLSEKSRKPVVESYLSEVTKHLTELEKLLEVAQKLEVPAHMEVHKTYQLATLEFGIAYYQFVQEWYEKKFGVQETSS
jgi:DNA-binding PadR family transcriptional regulator